jgi:hypothetical protein
MESPQSSSSKRRQWLIAAAAVAGVLVFALVLWNPEAVPPPSKVTKEIESPRRPPRFDVKENHPSRPTIVPETEKSPEKIAACHACEEKNRGGVCLENMGCDGLAGEDKALCENLRSCLRAHPECNTVNPVYCYCGESQGMKCVTEPKGPCAQEAIAAAKTTDLASVSRRFWRPDFPSGRATQVSACHLRACKDECVGLQL